ncbi:MAG: hypothetical protein IT385_13240 [Deltaproteobacteria bacterium]|nr:hypothetical protein [Deltaproteobacteria bacterium]
MRFETRKRAPSDSCEVRSIVSSSGSVARSSRPSSSRHPPASATDAATLGDAAPDGDVDAPEVTTSTRTCGNGVRELGEDCDGGDVGEHTCQGLGFASGALACSSVCTLEVAACAGPWSCPEDAAEPDDGAAQAPTILEGRHVRALCGGREEEDWVAIDAPAAGRDALTLVIYPTGAPGAPAPEIWGPREDGDQPAFMMNVVDSAPIPDSDRRILYWRWSETEHAPRFGPRPARVYLRVHDVSPGGGVLYSVGYTKTGSAASSRASATPAHAATSACRSRACRAAPGSRTVTRGRSAGTSAARPRTA